MAYASSPGTVLVMKFKKCTCVSCDQNFMATIPNNWTIMDMFLSKHPTIKGKADHVVCTVPTALKDTEKFEVSYFKL